MRPATRAALAAMGSAKRRATLTISLKTWIRAPAATPRKMMLMRGETNV